MTSLLTFIIPVRHPQNSRDWSAQIRNLRETAASIANQTSPDWRAIIVANAGASLPELPPRFEVAWVDFPPNPLHDRGSADIERFYDSVRLDKGRRILAGMLRATQSRFVMVVDDDDLVSRRLVEFVSTQPPANGFTIRHGLVWSDGGRLLYCHDSFSSFCGTSHIVRTELYRLPASADLAGEPYIKQMLGSHRFIEAELAARGTPLVDLPFRGAIYRIGHRSAHSRSGKILPTFIFNGRALRKPYALPQHLLKLRFLSQSIRQEFFGSVAPAVEHLNIPRYVTGKIAVR
jgi:hypothetical protein